MMKNCKLNLIIKLLFEASKYNIYVMREGWIAVFYISFNCSLYVCTKGFLLQLFLWQRNGLIKVYEDHRENST